MESISTSVIRPGVYPSFEYGIVFLWLRESRLHTRKPSLPPGRCSGWRAGEREAAGTSLDHGLPFNHEQHLMSLLPEESLAPSFMRIQAFFWLKKKTNLKNTLRLPCQEGLQGPPPPPQGSDLTGMLGGRSSDCLMKMNGENCQYQDHVGAPSPGCCKCDGISSLHLSVSYLG